MNSEDFYNKLIEIIDKLDQKISKCGVEYEVILDFSNVNLDTYKEEADDFLKILYQSALVEKIKNV